MGACGEGRQGSEPPDAAFVAQSLVAANTTVRFDASASRDNGLIMYYAFDFGDLLAPVEILALPFAEHSYELPGDYQVTLTIEDDLGNRSRRTRPLRVLAEADYRPCTSAPGSCDVGVSACESGECIMRPPVCFRDPDCDPGLVCTADRRCGTL